MFPGKSFFSAHEVSTCKISGCLSYRILDSGPDGTQTTLTFTLAAVILVLVGAYSYGGYMARRSMEEKERQEDRKRLQSTVEVVNETNSEIRQKDASAIHRELHDKWVRN